MREWSVEHCWWMSFLVCFNSSLILWYTSDGPECHWNFCFAGLIFAGTLCTRNCLSDFQQFVWLQVVLPVYSTVVWQDLQIQLLTIMAPKMMKDCAFNATCNPGLYDTISSIMFLSHWQSGLYVISRIIWHFQWLLLYNFWLCSRGIMLVFFVFKKKFFSVQITPH